jgi:hypothetical protein
MGDYALSIAENKKARSRKAKRAKLSDQGLMMRMGRGSAATAM